MHAGVLQVELYAECAPENLLPFLQSSKQFNKDAALEVCRERGLVREQVFILGRLSRASEALQLIIGTLHDLPQAIAFVSSHEELWDELLVLVVKDPELTGELLDQVCVLLWKNNVGAPVPDMMTQTHLIPCVVPEVPPRCGVPSSLSAAMRKSCGLIRPLPLLLCTCA